MKRVVTYREYCRSCAGSGIAGSDTGGAFRSFGTCRSCDGLGFCEHSYQVEVEPKAELKLVVNNQG